MIGINEYFGWYPGPNGQIADRTLLPQYLDSVRACYPDKAVVVSEFGAEANRDGPVEEKGTFAFQQDFVHFHLGVDRHQAVASAAPSTGRCRSSASDPGGRAATRARRRPSTRRACSRSTGAPKPAWFDVQQLFKATNQLGGA